MTTEPNEADSAYPPELGVVVEVNSVPDSMLRDLVALVDDVKAEGDAGITIDLTLYVSGLVIPGTLISYRSYVRAFAAQVRRGVPPEFQVLGETLASGVELHIDDEAPARLDYIHLRDATVYMPGTPGYVSQELWRGRLSHVSAWSLGNSEPGPARR